MAQSYKGKKVGKIKDVKVKDIKSKDTKDIKDKNTKEKLNIIKVLKNNKIILIVILIVIIIFGGSGFGLWLKTYNEPTNKLKRYLENNSYTCGKSLCQKKKDDVTYSVNYKKASYKVINNLYTINISKKEPYVILNDSKVCSYVTEEYETFNLIDETFSYDKDCAKYIEDINKSIKEYKNILSNARVTIDDFSK